MTERCADFAGYADAVLMPHCCADAVLRPCYRDMSSVRRLIPELRLILYPDSRKVRLIMYEQDGAVVPVEVKAGRHKQAKSLMYAQKKYDYPLAYRYSVTRHADSGAIRDMPLYMAGIV